jgi:hypothetical protein
MKKNSYAFLREGRGVKSLLVVAMMIITASFVTAQEENAGFSLAGGRFGQVNLKVGIDVAGTVQGKYEETADMGGGSLDYLIVEHQPSDPGFTLTAEYLSPLLFNVFKGGIGVQYAFPRTSWGLAEVDLSGGDSESPNVTFSYLPIYAALQLHPAKSFQELFLRGNIGYMVPLTHTEKPETSGVTKKAKQGGLYWGVAAGFEFDWGLIVECSYSQNYYQVEIEQTGAPDMLLDMSYSKIGISVGYKLKL